MSILKRIRFMCGVPRVSHFSISRKFRRDTVARHAPSIFCVLFFCVTGVLRAESVWVSPDGSDSNAGSQTQPFASLERARQEARRASERGVPLTVFLKKGTYYLSAPLVFTSADSGTVKSPITYQAEDADVVISGGVKLELKWTAWRDGIQMAKVPAGLTTDQLFVNGVRQSMARYPNLDPNVRVYNGHAADAISIERTRSWKNPQGGYIHAMHAAEWGGFHFLITGKNDDGSLKFEGGWQNNRPAGMHRQFRFVENIFEELDSPGEWFLDQGTSTLYFYPPAGLDLSTATIEAVRLRHLVEFRGTMANPVRSIQIKGITFRHAARTFMENKEPLVRSDWTTYRGGAILFDGAEDCLLEDCTVDQVGGNAVFVNNFNRRITVRGCLIAQAGGNGVAFVGDRDAARVPRDWNDKSQSYGTLDRTPGPKSDNYPADSLVEDCLIYQTGRVEKQTSPVQIELSQGITVRHCSLYDVPRAGINIGDGCWGGHLIEHCDIFDTVKETGDHGSFNSWGRDRFWNLAGLNLNDDKLWEAEQKLPLLDANKTVVIRNNRWRCDHGWDVDLDDGSTNYHLINNLCLAGGMKLREGFYRTVENNIFINNGFHPHVWYKHSQDVVRRNIMLTDHYLPAGGMPATAWGREMDFNLVHFAGLASRPAAKLAGQSKRDEHSIEADALFVDPENGDFRVRDGSPALALGFVNFPMDQFGVQRPKLKALARTPEIPRLNRPASGSEKPQAKRTHYIWQAQARDISGLGDRSAYGLPNETGVLLQQVRASSAAAAAGFMNEDVVVGCNGKPVTNLASLQEAVNAAAGSPLNVSLYRKQKLMSIELRDYAYSVAERADASEFKTIPIAAKPSLLSGRISSTSPGTMNEPVSVLTDGKLTRNYGPVFGNGIQNGMYKLDLGAAHTVRQINTFSFNQNENRGRQRFVVYGSNSNGDPGWNVTDVKSFVPICEVDSAAFDEARFAATSIRQAGGQPLGSFRWLIWSVAAATETAGGENTAFQEFQVIGSEKP